jgi:hypothetical protein
MSAIPTAAIIPDKIEIHYVYLVACRGPSETYVKIGQTCNLKRRISEIQTSCPLRIAHAFAIPSDYWEEARGLEKLLHMLLKPERLRGEWYEGSERLFSLLDVVLRHINAGGFSFDELLEMPDFVGPEVEIMLHRHEFCFYAMSLPLTKGVDPLESATITPPGCIAAILSGAGAT